MTPKIEPDFTGFPTDTLLSSEEEDAISRQEIAEAQARNALSKEDLRAGLGNILLERRTTGESYLMALALQANASGSPIWSPRTHDEVEAARAERRRKKSVAKKSKRRNR